MARNVVLALGALAWTVLAVSMIVLYSIGHWVAPTITIIAGMGYIAMRLIATRLVRKPSTEAA
jgi:integral membrane sensor domain MASE1